MIRGGRIGAGRSARQLRETQRPLIARYAHALFPIYLYNLCVAALACGVGNGLLGSLKTGWPESRFWLAQGCAVRPDVSTPLKVVLIGSSGAARARGGRCACFGSSEEVGVGLHTRGRDLDAPTPPADATLVQLQSPGNPFSSRLKSQNLEGCTGSGSPAKSATQNGEIFGRLRKRGSGTLLKAVP